MCDTKTCLISNDGIIAGRIPASCPLVPKCPLLSKPDWCHHTQKNNFTVLREGDVYKWKWTDAMYQVVKVSLGGGRIEWGLKYTQNDNVAIWKDEYRLKEYLSEMFIFVG